MISENKKIAKNTIIVYANMFISMIIGLFTSRLVLQALGVSDFGLYNVVGGVVILCTFLLSSLSVSTTRFLNLEMGNPNGDLNRIFNVCNVLHIVLALLVLLFSELLGFWYIDSYLNVDLGKISDAKFVFQVSIIVSCVGVANVPYVGLFNANENFLFSAIVNISLSIIQLLLVFFLVSYEGNRLRAYSLIMSLSTLISFIIYRYYCYKYWPGTIKWNFTKKWPLYKEVLMYNNFNILSTAALMIRSQGAALLINSFFGTAVNGAYAISKSVESYVLSFSANFDRAAVPQITQNYSSGNIGRMTDLACKTGRYTIFLMMIVFFPLYSEIEMVLTLWLGNVPEGAVDFCKATLTMAFVGVTGAGVSTVTDCNKIEVFKTVFSVLLFLCLIFGYILFKSGSNAYILIYMFAVVDSLWRAIQLILANKLLKFDSLRYIKDVYGPALKSGLIVIFIIYLSSLFAASYLLWHIVRFMTIALSTIFLIYKLGLIKGEQELLKNFVRSRVKTLS